MGPDAGVELAGQDPGFGGGAQGTDVADNGEGVGNRERFGGGEALPAQFGRVGCWVSQRHRTIMNRGCDTQSRNRATEQRIPRFLSNPQVTDPGRLSAGRKTGRGSDPENPDMQETWSGWHDRRGHNGDEAFPWTQTQTGEWSDFNQRMWYVLNLFHALIADTTQIDFAGNKAEGMEFEPYEDARVRPRFTTPTLNKLLIELDGLPPVPQGLPDASSGSSYLSNTVSVPAGSSARLASGTLPAGLTINASGAISGTPNGGGDFSFGVEVVDNGLVVSEGLFELTVVGPIITSPEYYDSVSLPDIEAVVYYPGIAPEAPNFPTIISYESVGNALPPGVALNTATGVMTGSVDCFEWMSFEIRVTDSEGQHASKEFFPDQCI